MGKEIIVITEEINVLAGGILQHIAHKNLAALENKELEEVLGFRVCVYSSWG